jgi:hypothetical protein
VELTLVLFPAGFALALLVRRRYGGLAAAGVPIALLGWVCLSLLGAFEDDPEGTAGPLMLAYGVPAWAGAWAFGVAGGSLTVRARERG